MIFKNDWEKTVDTYNLPRDIIPCMVAQAFPNETLISQEVISDGCANFNIKICLKDNSKLYILRIYMRDEDAAFREQQLSSLLKLSIPIPIVNFVGDYDHYRFAIAEFLPGITLRELLLSNEPHSVSEIMFEVGVVLSKIASRVFCSSGFLNEDLTVVSKVVHENYLTFAKECLKNQMVIDHLDANLILRINLLLEQLFNFLPSSNKSNLVHGDFDPSNILVDKINGDWKITGVLDWEFAFSGSVMCDVANMLRYAHQMPIVFTDAFINGLKSGGINLPENWRITCDLLNLISLLDCLARSNAQNSLNRCTDICALIKDITYRLECY